MATPNNFNFPYFPPPQHPFPPPTPAAKPPPAPLHPSTPPPPHVSPPPPFPPSPSPDNHPTIIVIVFVSFGGLLLLTFLAVALCCFLKKKKKNVQETDIVHLDDHLKVKEAIVEGPHGPKAVMLDIEDDVHMDEFIIRKDEKFGGGLHAKAGEGNPTNTLEMGASTSGSGHHQL